MASPFPARSEGLSITICPPPGSCIPLACVFISPWLKMEAPPLWPRLLPLLLFSGLCFHVWAAKAPSAVEPDVKETMRVNVRALKRNEQVYEQVVLNLTFVRGDTYINDFQVKRGVTRMTFTTLISNEDSHDSKAQEHEGIVGIRILVHEWPLASGSDSTLIIVEEEVTEIEGYEAEQVETVVLEILVNKELRVERHSRYMVSLNESMLHSLPRDGDVLITQSNPSGKDAQGPLQTTSQYLSGLVETTVDEEPSPGKLPETPLRAEPTDSYKVMCKWVDDLRTRLSFFWLKVLPVLFNFMEVTTVGIAGAFLILQLLRACIPSCKHKGILYHGDITVLPIVAIPLLLEIPENMEDDCKEDMLQQDKQ
ncbi:glycoprotein integral membrane protein 1 isoform X2 [Ambystoma mexicanum]|uniref:glycoprotein integral membrane protein 1 isoform X2 n=1 Tax=Ambystoma mexicanum TaxID=8296 RepID=UPI0037E8B9E6